MARDGWLDRPDYDDALLYDTVGYVRAVWVEQEGPRDVLRFALQIWTDDFGRDDPTAREFEFLVPLDLATTVALAQLQLLIEAMRSSWDTLRSARQAPLLVRVHFNFQDADHDAGFVYWLGVYDGLPEMTTMSTFFRRPVEGWYTTGHAGWR